MTDRGPTLRCGICVLSSITLCSIVTRPNEVYGFGYYLFSDVDTDGC